MATNLTNPPALQNVFSSLSRSLIQELERVEFTTHFPSDSVLFSEGQSPRGIFLVLRGRVKLSVTSKDGKTLIVRVAQAGEVLGIGSSISGREYEATAETLEGSDVSFVKRSEVARLMRSNNEFALWLAEGLSQDCNLTCREIRNLVLAESAKEKLARLLIDNLDRSSLPKQPCKMKVGFTHEQMAQMIGSSRETVTRTLAAFRKRHWIEQYGATLLICDRAALESMVSA
jgi:CRP/FNR family transcriptional regulator